MKSGNRGGDIRVSLSVFGREDSSAIRARREVLPRGCTVKELLDRLADAGEMPVRYGGGEGYSEFFVVVDGVNVMVGDGLSTLLREGSRVLVLPAMAGG